MTPKQFSTALTRLGFNQQSFARCIGVSDRMVRFWISGEYPVPRQTAILVNLMLDTKSSEEDLRP